MKLVVFNIFDAAFYNGKLAEGFTSASEGGDKPWFFQPADWVGGEPLSENYGTIANSKVKVLAVYSMGYATVGEAIVAANEWSYEKEGLPGEIRAFLSHPAEEKALALDSVKHAKANGHVYQVWHDGEITIQKAGSLLWQRSLHTIIPPVKDADKLGLRFPHRTTDVNSFAWVGSEEEAMTVRNLIGRDLFSEFHRSSE
jgi:hypothetical protein